MGGFHFVNVPEETALTLAGGLVLARQEGGAGAVDPPVALGQRHGLECDSLVIADHLGGAFDTAPLDRYTKEVGWQ